MGRSAAVRQEQNREHFQGHREKWQNEKSADESKTLGYFQPFVAKQSDQHRNGSKSMRLCRTCGTAVVGSQTKDGDSFVNVEPDSESDAIRL